MTSGPMSILVSGYLWPECALLESHCPEQTCKLGRLGQIPTSTLICLIRRAATTMSNLLHTRPQCRFTGRRPRRSYEDPRTITDQCSPHTIHTDTSSTELEAPKYLDHYRPPSYIILRYLLTNPNNDNIRPKSRLRGRA